MAPAATALSPCCASSSRIVSMIARLLASSAGKPSRCVSRCAQTWRSVSAIKPRLHLSPSRLAELLNALFAPGQMIEFLGRRVLHLLLNSLVASDRRVALIQGLRSNFACMVYTHKPRGMRSLCSAEVRFFDRLGGIVSCRTSGRRRDGTQRIVRASQQAVDRGKFTNCHNWIIANPCGLTVYSAAFLAAIPK